MYSRNIKHLGKDLWPQITKNQVEPFKTIHFQICLVVICLFSDMFIQIMRLRSAAREDDPFKTGHIVFDEGLYNI